MLLQIHTLPIATKFILWQSKFKNFYGSDALVNTFNTLLHTDVLLKLLPDLISDS